jgi:fatty-acyl-CoA synthase
MQTPLTPVDFARRARRLYGRREAVVDGDQRFTYCEFLERCERWSAALAALGVRSGDRVATIAPNSHQHLEQFYAVPALGAVLVPLNYRLTADDFAYMVGHSGAEVLCVHEAFLELVDSARGHMPGVRHFVALEGRRAGWLEYEQLLSAASPAPGGPPPDENALLTINYTSGTTARPKGVMITHRNAWINSIGTLVHWPMTPADRYLWTLPMFHANGWTFVWTVTAAGARMSACARSTRRRSSRLINREQSRICARRPRCSSASPTRRRAAARLAAVACGCSPRALRRPRPRSSAGGRVRLGHHAGYGLTETSPFITVCEPRPEHEDLAPRDGPVIKARQGVELLTSGELRWSTRGVEVPHDGADAGRDRRARQRRHEGLLQRPEAPRRPCRAAGFIRAMPPLFIPMAMWRSATGSRT